MLPSRIDVADFEVRRFRRFVESPASAGRIEPSVWLNDIEEHTVQKFTRVHPPSLEYLLRLDDVTAHGTMGVVRTAGCVFAPSTVDSDWSNPERLEQEGEPVHTPGSAHFIAYRHSDNYFHWTYQSMAALLDMQEAGLPTDRDGLIVSPLNAWRRRTLELADVDPDSCIVLERDAVMKIDSIMISAFLSRRSVNRPTQRFIDLFDRFSRRVCTPPASGGSDRIYISRLAATRRVIENEDEICRLMTRYGFEVIQTEDMSVDEQIGLFASARHVVAPHGAGLVNLLYAQRCESVTEILQAGPSNQCMFRICEAKGIPHYSLQAECVKEGRDWQVVSRVDLGLLERQLDAITSGAVAKAA